MTGSWKIRSAPLDKGNAEPARGLPRNKCVWYRIYQNVDFQAGGAGKIVRCFPVTSSIVSGRFRHRYRKAAGLCGCCHRPPGSTLQAVPIPLFQQSASLPVRTSRRSASMPFTAGARNSVMAPFRESCAAAVQSFQSVPGENRIGQGRIKRIPMNPVLSRWTLKQSIFQINGIAHPDKTGASPSRAGTAPTFADGLRLSEPPAPALSTKPEPPGVVTFPGHPPLGF